MNFCLWTFLIFHKKEKYRQVLITHLYFSVLLPVGSSLVGDAFAYSPKIRPIAFLLPVSFHGRKMYLPLCFFGPFRCLGQSSSDIFAYSNLIIQYLNYFFKTVFHKLLFWPIDHFIYRIDGDECIGICFSKEIH